MFRKLVLMSAILAVELAFVGLILPIVPIPWGEIESKVFSVILANWFLLCFWLSAGSTRAPFRQLTCTALLAFVGVVAAVIDTQPIASLARGLTFIAVSWCPYAILYLPRRVAGMKLTFFDPDRKPSRKSQFGIRALLGFMAALSVPLALGRLAFLIHPPTFIGKAQLLPEAPMLLLIMGVVSAAVLPLGIAAFANRAPTLKIALALIWCIIATLIIGQFLPSDFEGGGPIFLLTWGLIAFVFMTARLLGVRWEAGQANSDSPIRRWRAGTARFQAAVHQGAIVVAAVLIGGLLIFTPIVLQFLTIYVLAAAAPALVLAAHGWRRQTPNRFWAVFLFSGAVPWAYAMFNCTQEAWTLLFGVPYFASTSPVEPIPTSGLDWSDLIAILLFPLVVGSLGGAFAVSFPPAFSRLRRVFGKKNLEQASELAMVAKE